jgi:nucleoside-diphosphate-sugar epimerase
MNRVAITGATGMLGATLTQQLICECIRVLAIVRPGSGKRSNLHDSPLVRVVECPLTDLGRLEADGEGCDAFFHFAWDGTYGDSRNDAPLQAANIRATLDAVALAARLGCRSFGGAGSQAEYGIAPAGCRLSPDTPARPLSGYGIAKLAAMGLGRMYAGQLGIRFVWARIVSAYGPMDNPYTLTMGTIRKRLAGEATHFTAGEQIWDFLFSEDAARAFRLMAEKGLDGAVYVLGSGQKTRLKDAIETMCRMTNPDLPVGLGDIPYLPGQPMYLCADISDLTRDTGFSPSVSFDEGIQRTMDWVKEQAAP